MNNSYFNPNANPNLGYNNVTGSTGNPTINSSVPTELTLEQSYVENILRMNKGKIASFYMTFPDAGEWKDKIFTGVIEQAARDHFVFDEEINYKII